MQDTKIEELVQPVYFASRDVMEAVRNLLLRTEALEEEVLKSKLPEVECSEEETNRVRKALHEMREEGAGITLEEFNKHQGINQKRHSEVQSHGS